MAKKEPRIERIEYSADRRTAQRLRNLFMKILSKDKKSDGISLSYTYKPFRKRADFTISGNEKTVLKCIKALGKFALKQEKTEAKRERDGMKATPIAKGSYYTMRSAKERRKGSV
ncbi:MAG: hypothetical protein IKC26_11700 [Clostridia bacterium]|nr:hypothetical protein [Clostridia bacterium]MBR2908692.1 hypothetical protein [Clostridia bacterium]